MERPRFEHVVVLDVTQSMNVQDQQLDGKPVSRLALRQARAAAVRSLQLPCGSKVGWAIFTEYRSVPAVRAGRGLRQSAPSCARRSAGIDDRMAWTGDSEVAKGLHSAIGIARQLPGAPSLVFVTDGHEAPPLNPRYRPAFDDKPGEVRGADRRRRRARAGRRSRRATRTAGRSASGRADEVMQTDRQGRGASVRGER